MNWAMWQQHKKQWMIFGGLIAAFAVFAVPTGMHFWHVYQQALAGCAAAADCDQLADQLFRHGHDANIFDITKFAVLFMPALLGIFFGLALVGREYNDGTNLLAWTQGVSRRRWLSVKIGWTVAITALGAGIIAALSTWWWRAGNALYLSKFQPLDFAVQGILPVALTIFAVVAAIALGAWLKRTLLALGILVVILLVVQISVPTYLRPHYAAPRVYTEQLVVQGNKNRDHRPDQAPVPAHTGAIWVNYSAVVDSDGTALNWVNPPEECSYTIEEASTRIHNEERSGGTPDVYIDREGGPAVHFRCLKEKGYHWEVRYQSADRYWKFQIIESVLYLALSVPFVAATYWLVLRRDA